jgi:hypothetical protein
MKPAPNHPLTPDDLKTTYWEILPATKVYTELATQLQHSPFLLAIHGSLVRTWMMGNDLDLIATQWKYDDRSFDVKLSNLIQLLTHPEIQLAGVQRLDGRRAVIKLHHVARGYNRRRIIDLLVVML